MRATIPLVLVLAACDPQDFVPIVVDTGPATTTDTDPPVTQVRDDRGSIVVSVQRPDDLFGPQTIIRGMFVQNDYNIENLATCFGIPEVGCADDVWPAGYGDVVELLPKDDVGTIGQLVTRDVGDTITIGPWEATRRELDGLFYYTAQPPTDTLPVGDLELVFGGEWGEWEGIGGAAPSAFALTSHDATTTQRFPSAELLELTWEPGAGGDIYLVAVVKPGTVGERRFLQRLEDDGQHGLNLNLFGQLTDGDPLHFLIGRWAVHEVDVDGHELVVQIQSNQWLRGTFSALGVRDELPAGLLYDDCAEAEGQPPIAPGSYFGDLSGYGGDFTRGDGDCVDGPSAGPDAILPVRVEPDQLLTASFEQRGSDAVLYLAQGICEGTPTCIDAVDAVGRSQAEGLAWRNATGAPVDAWLVIDTVQGPITDLFELDISVEQVLADPLQSSCVDAMAQGPVERGNYYGIMGTFPNLLDCDGAGYVGGDGKAQIYLLPGQTLVAEVFAPGGRPYAYLTYNCSVGESCLQGVATTGGGSDTTTLTYQNTTGVAEFLYLVVDSGVDGPGGTVQDYFLEIGIQ